MEEQIPKRSPAIFVALGVAILSVVGGMVFVISGSRGVSHGDRHGSGAGAAKAGGASKAGAGSTTRAATRPRSRAARIAAAVARAKREGFDPNWGYIYPASAMPLWLCAVTVFGFGIGVPVLLLLYMLVRLMRNVVRKRLTDSAAKRAEERGVTESQGPTCLYGRVAAVEDGGSVAARLTVTQQGHESKGKKSWSTTWTEVGRKLEVRPFVLELKSGQRVRVTPDDKAMLADDLDQIEVTACGERVRRAHLEVGENAYVTGTLARVRDPQDQLGERVPTLLPPSDGERMLMSTRPLSESFYRRVRHDRFWAILLVLVAGGLGYGLHAPYLVGRFNNELSVAVVSKKQVLRKKKSTHYLVRVIIAPTGQSFREALDYSDWRRIRIGARLPVMYSPSHLRYAQLGQAVAAPYSKLVISVVWLLPFVIIYFYRKGQNIPWWEMERLSSSTSGRLPKVPSPSQQGDGDGDASAVGGAPGGGGTHISA